MASSEDQNLLAKGVLAYMGTVSELTSSKIDKKIAQSPELQNFLVYLSERLPSIMGELLHSVSAHCEDALRTEKESQASRKRPEPPNSNGSIAKRLKLDRITEVRTGRNPAVRQGNIIPTEHRHPGPQSNSPCSKITLQPKSTSDKDKGSIEEVSEDIDPIVKHGERKHPDITFTSVSKPQDGNIVKSFAAPQHDSQLSTEPQCPEIELPCTSPSEKDEYSRHENSELEGSIGKPGEDNFSNIALTPINPADIGTTYNTESGLTIGSQSSEMALPQSSAPENQSGAESESPEDSSITEPDAIFVHQKEITDNLPTTFTVESGLSIRSSPTDNHFKATLLALTPTRINTNVHAEVTKVWKIVLLLDFFKTKREVYQYLENREKMPGEKLHTRSKWESTDPSKILETLQNVKRDTVDNKIHRAYGQTMLFSSVNAQVADGYRSTVTGHRCNHTALLEELARQKAGPVTETEIRQIISSYFYEYYAGQRWLAVIDWFGGDGIVLIFLIAGNCTLIWIDFFSYNWKPLF